MSKKITYKGYSMVLDGPNPKDGSYGGVFKYPGSNCIVGGETFEEAKADFELFVDEHLEDIRIEKKKVETVKPRSLFKTKVEFKGVLGTVEVDIKNKGFMGHIIKAQDKYKYSGRNYDEFIENFHNVVDKYVKDKKNLNNIRQFKGSFNVRVNPDVHKDAYAYASDNNITLNKLVEIALKEKIYGIR